MYQTKPKTHLIFCGFYSNVCEIQFIMWLKDKKKTKQTHGKVVFICITFVLVFVIVSKDYKISGNRKNIEWIFYSTVNNNHIR